MIVGGSTGRVGQTCRSPYDGESGSGFTDVLLLGRPRHRGSARGGRPSWRGSKRHHRVSCGAPDAQERCTTIERTGFSACYATALHAETADRATTSRPESEYGKGVRH